MKTLELTIPAELRRKVEKMLRDEYARRKREEVGDTIDGLFKTRQILENWDPEFMKKLSGLELRALLHLFQEPLCLPVTR
jgi:hypothetical protein